MHKSLQLCPSLLTIWTVACQAPLSVGILQARIPKWVACPPPGDLPNPGIEPVSFMSPVLADGFLPLGPPGKPFVNVSEESLCSDVSLYFLRLA